LASAELTSFGVTDGAADSSRISVMRRSIPAMTSRTSDPLSGLVLVEGEGGGDEVGLAVADADGEGVTSAVHGGTPTSAAASRAIAPRSAMAATRAPGGGRRDERRSEAFGAGE